MHCPRCGVVIPDDDVYCLNCGYLEEIMVPEVVRAKVKAERKTYAGFCKRLAAAILDMIFLIIAEGLIIAIMAALLLLVNYFLNGALAYTTIWGFFSGFGLILAVALNWAYFTIMESSSKQATLGKIIVGIKVTDLEKRRTTLGQTNKRYWLKIVSVISLFIGIIMIIFTKHKQGFHDLIADTLVIRNESLEVKKNPKDKQSIHANR